MELRRCSSLHFIQAIRGGLVIKTHNVNSHGRPSLVFKTLKDIYEAADAKNFDTPSTLKWQDRYESLAFDCDRVEIESPCLSLVERKTRERDPEMNEFNGDDDVKDSDSDDLNFGKMTLKQLKERCKTKKRKASDSACSTSMQESTILQPDEDELDLMTPLSCWKSKLSKSPKSKKKFMRSVSASSKNVISVKSEHILGAEDSPQSNVDFYTPITVKADDPAPEYSECQNMISVSGDFSICNEQVGLCGVEADEILEVVNCELENREPVSFTEQCKSCVLNKVSYNHLEDVEIASLLPPIGGETVEVHNHEKMGHQSSVLPVSEFKEEGYIKQPPLHDSFLEIVSPAKDQSSDTCDISQSCSYLQEISSQVNSGSVVQVSDVAIDNGLCCVGLSSGGDGCMFEDDIKEYLPQNLENCSLSNPVNNSSSCLNSYPCLSPDNGFVSEKDDSSTIEEKQPLIFTIADAPRNCLNPDNDLVVLGDDPEKKQPLVCVTTNAESNFSSGGHPCDVSNELSMSEVENYHHVELWQPPERLPSTRKAISPTSQERLCLAMNSVELYDDIDHQKCKGKLLFGKQTENVTSPADIEGAELSENPQGPGQDLQTKSTIIPKEILKKPKNGKKVYPPKGCLEGPHLSRSLPRLSTGCTSIQGCSESAIAFSQRQMHDIDSLAMKLMSELKSMKEIVEEKLLYEAYRNTSLKNDADEVKMAIKNATKVEETSRKWLAMMSRDCNRFCKIMKLTENDAPTSENAIQREGKKITFADEAGGMLCQVKFFESGMSADPRSDKEELQAK